MRLVRESAVFSRLHVGLVGVCFDFPTLHYLPVVTAVQTHEHSAIVTSILTAPKQYTMAGTTALKREYDGARSFNADLSKWDVSQDSA